MMIVDYFSRFIIVKFLSDIRSETDSNTLSGSPDGIWATFDNHGRLWYTVYQ